MADRYQCPNKKCSGRVGQPPTTCRKCGEEITVENVIVISDRQETPREDDPPEKERPSSPPPDRQRHADPPEDDAEDAADPDAEPSEYYGDDDEFDDLEQEFFGDE